MPRGKYADQMREPCIMAMVPAHNEEDNIERTIRSLLDQEYPIDEIIVVSDNSTDRTVELARQFPVTVIESAPDNCPACTEAGKNTHRKSGALNYAWWNEVARKADLVIFADGDAILSPHAVRDWVKEFAGNPSLGGSSSQPVLVGGEHWEMRPYARPEGRSRPLHYLNDRVHAFFAGLLAWYLPRLQRFEFAKTITQSINRGFVLVVSGVGCAWRNEALWDVAREPDQPGPWIYTSVVEDYHLTYQARRAGWQCKMSPTVWCEAGSMLTLKSLWYQRIKWCGGTDGDLVKFGFDRLNWRQWMQNVFLLVNVAFWLIWLGLEIPEFITTGFHINWWWQGFGFSLVALDLIHMRRMKHPRWRRDWKDWVLTASMIHLTVYNILSLSWGIASWVKVLYSTLGDLWAPQYRAEGMKQVEDHKIGIS